MSNKIAVAPDVHIKMENVGSDLRVRGWGKNEVRLSGEIGFAQVSDDGKTLTIEANGDCDMSVPQNASLTIENIGSDAKITDVHGAIRIDNVGSDLHIREAGEVQVDSIGSDLRLRQIKGNVTLDSVGSDATLDEIDGNLHIGDIGSDALIQEVTGNCVIGNVGSDLILAVAFTPGHEYSFEASSDVICRIPPDASVLFDMEAGDRLDVEAENGRLLKSEDNHHMVQFGDGAVTVRLNAGSTIRIIDNDDPLTGREFNFDFDFDFDFERAFEETARVTERARREAERMTQQIQREAERAAEQVRRQAERAAQQAQREAERIQRQQGRRGFNFGWSWGDERGNRRGSPVPPVPPIPPIPPMPPFPGEARPVDEPVTNDERLAILRMVETKQISVEQAEQLLAALEGRA